MLIQKFLRSITPKQLDLHVLLFFAVIMLLGLLLPPLQINTAQGGDEKAETVRHINRDELLAFMKASTKIKFDVESDPENPNRITWNHPPAHYTKLDVGEKVISHFWISADSRPRNITLEIANKWNANQRFSKLWVGDNIIVLQSDLFTGNGITDRQLIEFFGLCQFSRGTYLQQLLNDIEAKLEQK